MPVLNKNVVRHFKSVIFVLGIFALGIIAARILPNASEKKPEADQAMVEKISDDSLKLSSETLKNLKISPVKVVEVPEQLSVMGKISVAEDRTSMVAARVAGRLDAVYAPS